MVKKPRRRPEAAEHRPEVLAGLKGLPNPPGGNEFAHLAALYPSGRRQHGWTEIVSAFRSLPHDTRRRIVRRHREARGLIRDPRALFRDPDYLDWPR